MLLISYIFCQKKFLRLEPSITIPVCVECAVRDAHTINIEWCKMGKVEVASATLWQNTSARMDFVGALCKLNSFGNIFVFAQSEKIRIICRQRREKNYSYYCNYIFDFYYSSARFFIHLFIRMHNRERRPYIFSHSVSLKTHIASSLS